MNASELKTGETAIIRFVKEGKHGQRLQEMGFMPGNRIQLVGIGPFGSPLAFKVGFLHAALRIEEAGFIELELAEDSK